MDNIYLVQNSVKYILTLIMLYYIFILIYKNISTNKIESNEIIIIILISIFIYYFIYVKKFEYYTDINNKSVPSPSDDLYNFKKDSIINVPKITNLPLSQIHTPYDQVNIPIPTQNIINNSPNNLTNIPSNVLENTNLSSAINLLQAIPSNKKITQSNTNIIPHALQYLTPTPEQLASLSEGQLISMCTLLFPEITPHQLSNMSIHQLATLCAFKLSANAQNNLPNTNTKTNNINSANNNNNYNNNNNPNNHNNHNNYNYNNNNNPNQSYNNFNNNPNNNPNNNYNSNNNPNNNYNSNNNPNNNYNSNNNPYNNESCHNSNRNNSNNSNAYNPNGNNPNCNNPNCNNPNCNNPNCNNPNGNNPNGNNPNGNNPNGNNPNGNNPNCNNPNGNNPNGNNPNGNNPNGNYPNGNNPNGNYPNGNNPNGNNPNGNNPNGNNPKGNNNNENQFDNIIKLKYFQNLLTELFNLHILTNDDINNIRLKIQANISTLDNTILLLENLKNQKKSKTDLKYNEINPEFNTPIGKDISNNWAQDYSILSTDKWKVPMVIPPVCINTSPCKVCPTDSSSYPINLLKWNDSRNITGTQSLINKEWANNND